MFSGFKQFILRGNVVDLAIGVVIGVAFNSVITSLVKDLFTPLISVIVGKPNFSSLTFTFNHNAFLVGDFINSLVSFLINAIVIYFFVILPLNKLSAMTRKKSQDPLLKKCPECLSDIPVAAHRCAFCTVIIPKNTKRG